MGEPGAFGASARKGVARMGRWAHRLSLALDRGRRREDAGFAALRRSFYRGYWAATAAAVGARCTPLARELIRIERDGAWTTVDGPRVPLDDPVTLEVAGDKPLTTRLLAGAGLPTVPVTEFSLETLDEAVGRLGELGSAAVVKPAYGTGGGHGVTTGIGSPRALIRAARRAALWCPRLLLEPQVSGHSLRVLVLGGQVVDAVLRGPPTIRGDGRSTIRGLMRAETRSRLDERPIRALAPLRVDLDCRQTLSGRGLGLETVPGEGERLAVKTVVNQNSARDNRRVTGLLHPELAELARAAARVVGLDLAGVDLMVPAPGSPASDPGVRIGEVNSTPALHHHVLLDDAPGVEPVGPAVLEYLLARSGPPGPEREGPR